MLIQICLIGMLVASNADDPLRLRDDNPLSNRLPRSARSVLFAAEKIDIYSLDPRNGKLKEDEAKKQKKDIFRGWPVLGVTNVADKDARKTLVEQVTNAIGTGSIIEAARCFHPRHAIRATHDGKTVDLIICLECRRVEVYENGQCMGTCVTRRTAQKTMNQILSDAKIKIAP